MKTTAEKLDNALKVLNGEIARVMGVELNGFSFIKIDQKHFPKTIHIKFAGVQSVKEAFLIFDEACEAYQEWLIDTQNLESYKTLSEEANHFSISKKDLETSLNLFKDYRPSAYDSSAVIKPS